MFVGLIPAIIRDRKRKFPVISQAIGNVVRHDGCESRLRVTDVKMHYTAYKQSPALRSAYIFYIKRLLLFIMPSIQYLDSCARVLAIASKGTF